MESPEIGEGIWARLGDDNVNSVELKDRGEGLANASIFAYLRVQHQPVSIPPLVPCQADSGGTSVE
jgi:hypothetical protein